MTRRAVPGSGIKPKLDHVIVVLKSAKRPAEIQVGPGMAAHLRRPLPQAAKSSSCKIRKSAVSPYFIGDSAWCVFLDFRDTSRNSVEHIEHRTGRRLIAAASADGVGKDFFEPCKIDQLLVRTSAR
jgi:hypothetical protein